MNDKEHRQYVQAADRQPREGRSPSMRAQLEEEEAMGNDVEKLHSEGDEPDLCQYIQEKSDPAD